MGNLIGTIAGIIVRRAPATLYHADTEAALDWLAGIGQTITTPETETLDRLVRDLHGEANGSYTTSDIWAKFIGLYPFIGATAGSHSLNLKTPGTFTLTYTGTPVFSATGMVASNANYANTGIIPSATMGVNDKHMSAYSRTHHSGDLGYIGSFADQSVRDCILISGNQCYPFLSDKIGANFNTGGDTRGFFNTVRIAATEVVTTKNLTPFTIVKPSDTNNTSQIAIGNGMNFTGSSTDISIAFASAGAGMTPVQMTDYYNAVQAYQTALGRQV